MKKTKAGADKVGGRGDGVNSIDEYFMVSGWASGVLDLYPQI